MSISLLNFHPHAHYTSPHNKPLMILNPSKFHSTFSNKLRRSNGFHNSNSASVSKISVLNKNGGEDSGNKKVLETVKRWVVIIQSVWPGGSWWDLHESKEEDIMVAMAEPLTVLQALIRIWELVAHESWVLYAAFGSLTIAAISEISLPNLLASSIFSAQSGETAVFYRNLQLMVLLCFTSGICSGLRSGCFEIANTILLKRLRETLYGALIFQDISFFDKEAVGDLTSRLGADCQRG